VLHSNIITFIAVKTANLGGCIVISNHIKYSYLVLQPWCEEVNFSFLQLGILQTKSMYDDAVVA
jgi:hypothetical protein